ncbi:hypothetical protein EE612_000322 [Oryza sativa]|nr:hypothetical protein EE612_000322 [Oryza sativa]
MLPRASGITPENLFMVRLSTRSPLMSPRNTGIVPWNELLSNNSTVSTMQFFILLGIWPDNWFPDRTNSLRLVKLPTSEGRGPERELYDKFKYCEMEGSSNISFGIEPLK